MNKLTLYGVGNSRKFNYYTFKKEQKLLTVLSDLFSKIFEKDMILYKDEHKDRNKKIQIKDLKDHHDIIDIGPGKSRIDLFYGDKKVFAIIQCTEKLRTKFNKELFKKTRMPKPPKGGKYSYKTK